MLKDASSCFKIRSVSVRRSQARGTEEVWAATESRQLNEQTENNHFKETHNSVLGLELLLFTHHLRQSVSLIGLTLRALEDPQQPRKKRASLLSGNIKPLYIAWQTLCLCFQCRNWCLPQPFECFRACWFKTPMCGRLKLRYLSSCISLSFPLLQTPSKKSTNITKSARLDRHTHLPHQWVNVKVACYYSVSQHIKLTIPLISTHEIWQPCIKTALFTLNIHSQVK